MRPQDEAQAAYNRSHKITRSVVERGISRLKRRFHVLHGEIRLKPEKTCKIILVCAALHNVCKDRNIALPNENPNIVDVQPEDDIQPLGELRAADGHRYKDQFCYMHFNVED